jgi:hypothetical protein
LFVRFFLLLFVGGIMSCLFVFSTSCLHEGSCLVSSSFPPVVCRRDHVLCSSFPPVVCRRAHVLFVRLFHQLFVWGMMSCLFVFSFPQLFVGGLMYCLFVFTSVVCRRDHVLFVRLTSSCLQDGWCIVCSSFPPVVCMRDHVFSVRLFLLLFVGGIMSCLRWLCLFACGGVEHILCFWYVVLRFASCVVCFSWLSTFWTLLYYLLDLSSNSIPKGNGSINEG